MIFDSTLILSKKKNPVDYLVLSSSDEDFSYCCSFKDHSSIFNVSRDKPHPHPFKSVFLGVRSRKRGRLFSFFLDTLLSLFHSRLLFHSLLRSFSFCQVRLHFQCSTPDILQAVAHFEIHSTERVLSLSISSISKSLTPMRTVETRTL